MARFSGRESKVLAGGRAQRQKDYAEVDLCKITNFEKLKPDLDLIAQWAPELAIVDEAQRVRNWNTIAARALKQINSPYTIVLTGKSLENKLEELNSVVQFVDQRRLTCALQNMRMSCNSTFLLNHETDHGVKADELAARLDGLFTQVDTKAVVFSQWTRTHEIVIRRLEARGIGYVSFHGGVPSERRLALVDRFRDDPTCRVFIRQTPAAPVSTFNTRRCSSTWIYRGPRPFLNSVLRVFIAWDKHGLYRSSILYPSALSKKACSRCWRSNAHCRWAFSMVG